MKILGIILMIPIVWIALSAIGVIMSWKANKKKEKYRHYTEDRFTEEFMVTSMIMSALTIIFWVGMILILTS